MSPAANLTTSPGTTCASGTSRGVPPRTTVAVTLIIALSAAAASSAFDFLPKPEANAQDDHHEHDNGTARAAAVSGSVKYEMIAKASSKMTSGLRQARISSSSRL